MKKGLKARLRFPFTGGPGISVSGPKCRLPDEANRMPQLPRTARPSHPRSDPAGRFPGKTRPRQRASRHAPLRAMCDWAREFLQRRACARRQFPFFGKLRQLACGGAKIPDTASGLLKPESAVPDFSLSGEKEFSHVFGPVPSVIRTTTTRSEFSGSRPNFATRSRLCGRGPLLRRVSESQAPFRPRR